MSLSLIGFLAAVLALVAWIGWRFFTHPFPAGQATAEVKRFTANAHLPRKSPRSDPEPRSKKERHSDSRFNVKSLRPLAFALALACGMATGVLAFSARIGLDPLHALDFGRQEHIHAALNPEELVPPPSLPPSAFVGIDRPALETANRDWSRLDADFARLAVLVFARAEARGFPFTLLEGYRSPERQDALADLPTLVTNARAFQSKHQYGLALDAAPLRGGRLLISERDPWAMEAYRVLGEEAEKVGLTWGGRWKLKDFGHIEAPRSIAVATRDK